MKSTLYDLTRAKAQYLGFLRCPQWIPSGEKFDNFEVAYAETRQNAGISIPQKHLKLGHLVENFFMIWLQNQDRYRTIAAHVQMKQEGITLGEIDYLLYDEIRESHLHVELAFKFYLFDPNVDARYEAQWIGPNRRDDLALKLDKLREKQFPLLYHRKTMKLIEALEPNAKNFDQKLCLKACFFIPEAFDVKRLEPEYRNLIAGKWIHYKAFTQEKYGYATFHSPEKRDWLIDPLYEGNAALFEWEDFHSFAQRLDLMIAAKRSPLCFIKTPAGCRRMFIVWW